MFKFWKLKMKKFTLFNIKWHTIRFIFWIFSIKTAHQEKKMAPQDCILQCCSAISLKKWLAHQEWALLVADGSPEAIARCGTFCMGDSTGARRRVSC